MVWQARYCRDRLRVEKIVVETYASAADAPDDIGECEQSGLRDADLACRGKYPFEHGWSRSAGYGKGVFQSGWLEVPHSRHRPVKDAVALVP
jgi:hypothetical protein